MQVVQRAEGLWLKITGVLLILLGLVLFVSPRVNYTTREKVIHTGSVDVTAKRDKTVALPRIFGLLIVAGGVMVIIFASRHGDS
jgi:uncharacterized membrane protein HdeD (DUF308 family)